MCLCLVSLCVSVSAAPFVSECQAAHGVSPGGRRARTGDALCPPAELITAAPSEQSPETQEKAKK